MKTATHLSGRIAVLAGLSILTVAPTGERSGADRLVDTRVEEHAGAALSLRVELGARKLRVIEGGKVTRSYDIAIGKSSNPTPRGNFQIRRMIWNPRWVPPNSRWARGLKPRPPGDPANPMGQLKIFFREPSYYIHGTPEEASVGQAISHGCIRMRNADVIGLGKLLMERGGQQRPASWFERVLRDRTRSQEVRLSRPVPLTIRS